jgi:hypothetical protein
MPPSLTPRLIGKGLDKNEFTRSRQLLYENKEAKARIEFGGAPLVLKAESTLDLRTDGKAFFKSTKQLKHGTFTTREKYLATVERVK